MTEAHAGRVWAMRTRFECEAAARFAGLASRLADVGAPEVVVAMADAAADEERRHARDCAELARSFGVDVEVAELEAMDRPHSRPAVLADVVSLCCITETVSAALLGEMVRRATHERVHDVVRDVLRDEVQHARIGWAYVGVGLDREERVALARALPRMLAGTVREELFGPDAAGAPGLGALSRRTRREVFLASLDDVVFPGLSGAGVDVDPARAWVAEVRPGVGG